MTKKKLTVAVRTAGGAGVKYENLRTRVEALEKQLIEVQDELTKLCEKEPGRAGSPGRPPQGMAMAYLIMGKPHVWNGEGYDGLYGWYSSKAVDTEEVTPIHPLDPADPQPWAISPESMKPDDRSLIVYDDGSWCAWPDDAGDVAKQSPSFSDGSVYKRHTIHGVDLLERVYLREGDEEPVAPDQIRCDHEAMQYLEKAADLGKPIRIEKTITGRYAFKQWNGELYEGHPEDSLAKSILWAKKKREQQ